MQGACGGGQRSLAVGFPDDDEVHAVEHGAVCGS